MIKASAPGKVHLIGEHAVVYGEPAIISAIGLRCYVTVDKNDKIKIENKALNESSIFELDEIHSFTSEMTKLWNYCSDKENFSELFDVIRKEPLNHNKAAIGIILEKLKINGGVSVLIESEIPVGAGVGSGAALSVALVRATSELYDKKISDDEVNELALEIEKIAHGTPSGGDNSTCCYGGLVWFRKGNHNLIESLKNEIPYNLENFVLVYTKKPEQTTGELVQLVRDLKEDYRSKRVKEIGKLTYEMREVLKRKDFKRMKEIINDAQKILAELGVSTPEIDGIASAVRQIGGAAKLCGAGGGGVMLCYHEDKKRLIETIKDLGYKPIEAELGVEGVKIE